MLNITVMLCPAPPLPTASRVARETITTDTTAELGFIMDDVMPVQNLSWSAPELDANIVYVPNPLYKPFSEDKNTKLYRGDSLIIEVTTLLLKKRNYECFVFYC